MSAPEERAAELRAQLRGFTGSQTYFRLLPWVLITEGAKFLADEAGCYWLMSDVGIRLRGHERTDSFATAKLVLRPEGGFTLTLDDGRGQVFWSEHADYTDFPLPEGVTLFAGYQEDAKAWVLMLPSEY